MSLQRREELIRIARRFDALVVADDVYDFLQWETQHGALSMPSKACLPRLVDVDRYLDGGTECSYSHHFGNAVSNGSFSKIVGPGCRTGWVEGTSAFIEALCHR